MADNRIAYGLAKKHGIDTDGMTPKQVWDALNEKGIDWQQEYKADRDAEADKREAYARKWTADGGSEIGNKEDFLSFNDTKKAKEFFSEISREWEKSLSSTELGAMKGYTDATFDTINKLLRDTEPQYKGMSEQFLESQIRNMDRAIAKYYLPQRIKTYRGTNLIEFGSNIKSFHDLKKIVGDKILFKAFTSTSTDRNVAEIDFAGEVIIEFDIPAGRGNGAYLEFITVMSSNKTNKPENEFLLKRNSEATIKAVEKDKDGKIIVRMEVV